VASYSTFEGQRDRVHSLYIPLGSVLVELILVLERGPKLIAIHE
jgi:hypothetical protein